jgi:hypothetical protein
MSTRLEDFISNNREEFDNDEPAPQIWNRLEKQLKTSSKSKRIVIRMNFLHWSAAAAVLILAGLGIFHLFSKGTAGNSPTVQKVSPVNPPANDNAANNPNSPNNDILNDINPTYAKEVYHFTQLIELKQTELKQIEKDHPDLYKQFVSDINKLDSSYNSLKKELPVNPNREQLLEAMIQNLRLQTELLNHQLQIIQSIKQSKSNTNASNSKSI